jgi:hypothetical protein
MILYGSTMSPFVRKVAAYAAEKGIGLELQPTGFPNPTPEFRAASPFGKCRRWSMVTTAWPTPARLSIILRRNIPRPS